jgi:hypothetical protein
MPPSLIPFHREGGENDNEDHKNVAGLPVQDVFDAVSTLPSCSSPPDAV